MCWRYGGRSLLCQVESYKSGTHVASLLHAWGQKISARTGWPGVTTLWLGEVASCISCFCRSVVACKFAPSRSVPEAHAACCWVGKQAGNDSSSLILFCCFVFQAMSFHCRKHPSNSHPTFSGLGPVTWRPATVK